MLRTYLLYVVMGLCVRSSGRTVAVFNCHKSVNLLSFCALFGMI